MTPNANEQHLEDTELRIGQTNHQLDSLGFFKRHGSEGDDLRRQLQRLQSEHTYIDGLYSRTVQEIRDERADNDPVAWIDGHADDIRYLRALEQELLARDRRAERQLVAAAQIDPPDHITAVLGPRPENHATRPAWERAVAAIETYRHRHDIPPDHQLSALGPAPAPTHPTPTSATPNAPSTKPGQSSASETTRSDPNEQQSLTDSANPRRANAASAATTTSPSISSPPP